MAPPLVPLKWGLPLGRSRPHPACRLLGLELAPNGEASSAGTWTGMGAGRGRCSPEQLQRDGAPGLGLHALAPEAQLGVDGAVEQEVLLQALGVEGADGRVVADLLAYESEPQVFPGYKAERGRAA